MFQRMLVHHFYAKIVHLGHFQGGFENGQGDALYGQGDEKSRFDLEKWTWQNRIIDAHRELAEPVLMPI